MSDWVPAGFLGLLWRGGSVEDNALLEGMAQHRLAVPSALIQNRREIWECVCQASPNLNKIPRPCEDDVCFFSRIQS